MSNLPYHEQKDIENVKHLRELIGELPLFCPEFLRGIEPKTFHGPELHMPMI